MLPPEQYDTVEYSGFRTHTQATTSKEPYLPFFNSIQLHSDLDYL